MIKVSVSFDWTQAPKASPDGMTVVFFPVGAEGRVWRYELPGRNGGEVELPAGTYNMLAYNNDLKYVFFNNIADMFTYCAYTDPIPLSWPNSVTDAFSEMLEYKSYHSPDALFCGTAVDVEVSLCSVAYRQGVDAVDTVRTECSNRIIRCKPSPRTSSYTCIMRHVTNAESMSRGYCLLSGLARTELIARDVLSDACAAFSFVASRDGNDISGNTRAFGCPLLESARQWLYLVFVLADGSVVHYRYDVTDQIRSAPNPRDVTIVVDNLDLPYVDPDSGGSTGSFDEDVGDWETVIIDQIIDID